MTAFQTEDEMYEPVRQWLHTYLQENLERRATEIKTFIGANEILSRILIREGYGESIKDAPFFDLKIDVFGVIKFRQRYELVIVECKKQSLGLIDLGQLIGYSHIIRPYLAILVSPNGPTAGLHKYVVSHGISSLLNYRDGGRCVIAPWKIAQRAPDYSKAIPAGSLDPVNLL